MLNQIADARQPTFEELKAKLERAAGAEISGNVYATVGLVEIRYRERLAVRPEKFYLSFTAFETLYLAMLQAKLSLQQHNGSGGAPAPGSDPVPGGKPQ
jgi:hypothetical protein